MFENLLQMVTQHAQEAIVNNSAVPNEHNEGAIAEVASAIQHGLSSPVQGGGLEGIMNRLKGGDIANNPMVQNIINSAAGGLATKFGVDGTQATSIVQSLIPQVMNSLSQHEAGGTGGFDIGSLISSFTGGNANNQAGGIGGLISGFLK